MLANFFEGFRLFIFQKELVIYKLIKLLCVHFGNVPGFERPMMYGDCCLYHFAQNDLEIPYEPNFIKISKEDKSTEASSSSQAFQAHFLTERGFKELDICHKRAQNSISIFEQMLKLINSKDLEYYFLPSFADFQHFNFKDTLLLTRKGTDKIICLSRGNGYIMPIGTSFVNLMGENLPSLNIIWNFKLLNCYYNENDHVINDIGELLTLSDLDYEECSLVEKSIGSFKYEIKFEEYLPETLFEKPNIKGRKNILSINRNLRDMVRRSQIKLESKKEANISHFTRFCLIVSHLLLLFIPFIILFSISHSFQIDLKKQKSFSLLIFIFAFTLASMYCFKTS